MYMQNDIIYGTPLCMGPHVMVNGQDPNSVCFISLHTVHRNGFRLRLPSLSMEAFLTGPDIQVLTPSVVLIISISI
jgi:hypothetical protein